MGRREGERSRAVVVERAARRVFLALPLQRHPRLHHLDDVGAGQQVVDECVGDAGHACVGGTRMVKWRERRELGGVAMSFLRTGPWCLVLLLGLVPALASAADKQAVLEFAMAVDAQGHPTDVRAPEGLPPSIGESVQAWARDLRFVPATVDGVAQPSTTTLYLTFTVGDDGTSQIVNASTGPGLVLGRTGEPPVHDGAGYVRIEYDGTGKVTDAHFEHQAAHNADRSFWRWAESFAKNTTNENGR